MFDWSCALMLTLSVLFFHSPSRSIKLGQFLWTKDGHIKLNDFNRCEIMLFDEESDRYCRYITMKGGGVWRAPEEYAEKPLDEKIDVWSMGTRMKANKMFCFLLRCSEYVDMVLFALTLDFRAPLAAFAGNNLYALLTGLKPHYHVSSNSKFERMLIDGETAFIDPRFQDRSFAEGKLAEIIPLCWAYDPDDRIDIFELIRLLRKALKENEQHLSSTG